MELLQKEKVLEEIPEYPREDALQFSYIRGKSNSLYMVCCCCCYSCWSKLVILLFVWQIIRMIIKLMIGFGKLKITYDPCKFR